MWEISLSGQVSACVCSIILGAILSVFYDIIRTTRKAGRNSFEAVFIGDMLFWLVSAVIVFLFLVSVTNGEIRGYIVFFCSLGFLIYRFTIGKLLFPIMCRLFIVAVKLRRKLAVLLVGFCLNFEKWVSRIFVRIKCLILWLFSHLKKLLKSMYSMLYTKGHKSKMEHGVND